MEKIKCYEDLLVWQKAHKLVLDVYEITTNFPAIEKMGLVSQLRRAVVSVPANIAEGHSRRYHKEFLRFLTISLGSLGEVKYYFRLAYDLKYIKESEYALLTDKTVEIAKMLNSLLKSLKSKTNY